MYNLYTYITKKIKIYMYIFYVYIYIYGPQKGECVTKVLVTFLRHLVDIGSKFGAHWISKGPQIYLSNLSARHLYKDLLSPKQITVL